MSTLRTEWRFFLGNNKPHGGIGKLPPPPPWRPFRTTEVVRERPRSAGKAATGNPPPRQDLSGSARDRLGRQCGAVSAPAAPGHRRTRAPASRRWSTPSRTSWGSAGPALGHHLASSLREALYQYDAVGRLQASRRRRGRRRRRPDRSAQYLRLGPLGTALLPRRPRVLLIDEIDKADLDLPNDLLNVLEEGEFEIPELAAPPERDRRQVRVTIGGAARVLPGAGGRVQCKQFRRRLHQQRRARVPAGVPAPLPAAGHARPVRGRAAG